MDRIRGYDTPQLYCDKVNFEEGKRALLALDPKSLATTDERVQLLERISLSFAEACDYDKYNRQLNDWLKTQPGTAEEKVRFLQQATLIGMLGNQTRLPREKVC
jgi:hypothetical protein